MSRLLRAAIAAALVLALVALQALEDGRRPRPDTATGGVVPPGAAAAALGGLRTPLLAAIWLEADGLWEEQRWWALRSRYELIVRLEPRIPSAWGLLGDLMILNLADRAGPEDAWAWKREGLEFIDRGLAANTDSYWLRLQRLVRLTTNLGGREEDRRRYRAWRGRTVEEDALRYARDLAERYAHIPDERLRPAEVKRRFAHLAFRGALAAGARGEDPAGLFVDAAARWRGVAEAYALEGAEPQSAYARTLADLAEELATIRDPNEVRRLLTEKLSPFGDYVEVEDLLGDG